MRTMLTLAWWWWPTLFIATCLRGWALPSWTRWVCAAALWLVGSGALTWLSAQLLGARAFSPWVTVVPVLAAAILGYWGLRKTRFKTEYARMQEEALAANAYQADAPMNRFGGFALLMSLLVAVFLLAAHFSGSIATRGASSEYLATSAVIRTWLAERAINSATLLAILNDNALPFFGWVQFGGARAALGWEETTDTLMRGLLLVVVLGFALEKLREARVSTLGAIAIAVALTLAPGVLPLLVRHSTLAVVILLTTASLAAWIGHPRPHVALLLATVAFIYNPHFGWPIALATALTLGVRSLSPKNSEKWLICTFGAVLVLLMMVLQREIFLPTALHGWFTASERPLLDWETLTTGGAVLLIALGLLALAILRRRYETPTSRHIQWLMGLLVAFTVLALLRARPSFLTATDAVRMNLLLAALSPPLLLWLGARALTTVHRLSDYAGVGAIVPAAGGAAVGAARVATLADTTPEPDDAPDDAPEITLDDLRDRLMAGYAALEGGDLTAAAAQAEDVLSYDPQFPDAHHLLGLVALRENRPGDALRAVLKALDVFPEHALFHLTVSDIYGMQSRFAEQAFALTEASRLDPSNMATKTKLLLAKRKSLMAQAAKADSGASDESARNAYEILVQRQQMPKG